MFSGQGLRIINAISSPSKSDTELGNTGFSEQTDFLLKDYPNLIPSTVGQTKFWQLRQRRYPPRRETHTHHTRGTHTRCPRPRILLKFLQGVAIFLLGAVTAIFIVPNAEYWPQPDNVDRAFVPFDLQSSSSHIPDQYLQSVLPIPCHSHNDYWRRRPLWSALATGCTSVEADITLIDSELYVGHSSGELSENRTLSKMYIQPLVDLLEHRSKSMIAKPSPHGMPGVFLQDSGQTLVILIDLKGHGRTVWPVLKKALEPLRKRQWLTYWDGKTRVNGPITVVGTGNTPFEEVISSSTHRDIFFDAPLNALYESDQSTSDRYYSYPFSNITDERWTKYDISNSYYASSSMNRALGPLWGFGFSKQQLETMRTQIKDAKALGLVPRYWGTPRWPRGLRNFVWGVLVREGTGILNVDDLRAARKGEWGAWGQPNGPV